MPDLMVSSVQSREVELRTFGQVIEVTKESFQAFRRQRSTGKGGGGSRGSGGTKGASGAGTEGGNKRLRKA